MLDAFSQQLVITDAIKILHQLVQPPGVGATMFLHRLQPITLVVIVRRWSAIALQGVIRYNSHLLRIEVIKLAIQPLVHRSVFNRHMQALHSKLDQMNNAIDNMVAILQTHIFQGTTAASQTAITRPHWKAPKLQHQSQGMDENNAQVS